MAKKQQTSQQTPQVAPSEEELQRQHVRFVHLLNTIATLGKWIVAGITIYGFAYATFYLPVAVSHGETTTIKVVQDWAANLNASVWLSWAAAGGAGLGVVEMRRRWVAERTAKDARIKELETQIDAKRTSSNVTAAGDPKKSTAP